MRREKPMGLNGNMRIDSRSTAENSGSDFLMIAMEPIFILTGSEGQTDFFFV